MILSLLIIVLLADCSGDRSEAETRRLADRTRQGCFGIRDSLAHDTLQAADTSALFFVDTMRAQVFSASSYWRPSTENFEYRFPIIRSTLRPEVARKITRGIWNEVYGFDKEDSTVFDGHILEAGEPGQIFLDFTLLSLTSRYLVIRILQEGCGAYCTYWESTYLYDLETGERIALTDIVTPKGLDWIARDGFEKARAKIVDYLAVLRSADPGMDSVAAAERVEFYSRCLESDYNEFDRAEELERLMDDEDWEHGQTYYILDDTLFLPRDDCSAHPSRALAELGNLENAYALRDIRSQLTEYGRRMFAVER